SMTSSGIRQALAAAEGGRRLSSFEAMALAECDDLAALTALAERLCLAGHGTHVSFSKKVFIPLTKLCRDVCHYCTFAHAPREARGRARVPFTTGILIGIGETRAERIEALLAIRDLHERHGHIQEVIVQNFRAKPGTRMSGAAEPTLADHAWTIAVARLVLGPAMNIQAPPNLQPDGLAQLVCAGINDWGGVSPVTPDHVNPEAPWPHLADLERATAAAGRTLVERLAVYPEFASEPSRYAAPPPRGGRMERHGLGSPASTVTASTNRRAKSDGVPGGGDIGAPTPPPGPPRSL